MKQASHTLETVIAALRAEGLIFQVQSDEVRVLMHQATRVVRVWCETVEGPTRHGRQLWRAR